MAINTVDFQKAPLSIQDKISRVTSRLSSKSQDIKIRMLGQRLLGFRFNLLQDKYQNRSLTITDCLPITGLILFPGNEVPVSNSDQNNTSAQTLHLYDLLPIQGFFQRSDGIKLQDILVFNIKLYDLSYQILALQVVDFISKGTVSDITHQVAILAPPTDTTILENPTYISLIENFKTKEVW